MNVNEIIITVDTRCDLRLCRCYPAGMEQKPAWKKKEDLERQRKARMTWPIGDDNMPAPGTPDDWPWGNWDDEEDDEE